MFMEFQFEDIFPRVGGEMLYALGFWPDNSVGDIIDMLLQMLEVSFTYVVSQFSFIHLFKIKDTWIYSRLEYFPSCEYRGVFYHFPLNGTTLSIFSERIPW